MNRKEVRAHLTGIFAPVVTPFDRRGEVDERCFRENLRPYVGSGLGGIVVAGSTGEAPYLTDRERLRLVEIARQIVRPPQLLIAGTGQESTRQTVCLSREAIACGADAVLVVTPHYYKPRMDSAALIAHYRSVADGVRRPVILYSIPQFTGVPIDADTIARLSRHSNIIGLKESSGDIRFVREVLRKVRPGFSVLIGSPVILLDALRAGAVGAVLGQATFVPELCVGVFEAFRKKHVSTARRLQERLAALARKISIPHGVAGIKAALDLCGYAGGVPRAPLTPLSSAARREVEAAIAQARAGLAL